MESRSILSRDAEYMQFYMRVATTDNDEPTDHERRKRTSITLPPPLKLPMNEMSGKMNDTPTSRRAQQSERRSSQPQTPAAAKKNTPFAQMSRDIKLRRIQQQQQELQMLLKQGRKHTDCYFKRGEEIYTDKDRAAAVNMGTRDIKLSLKLKKQQERSKVLQIPEQADPGTLLVLGGHEMKTGDLKVALSFINKALELQPSDKHALVSRSKCHLLLGLAQQALTDADAALDQDKTFVKGIFQKAEALYHLGDFEHSLMFYHRGLRLRPELAGFRLGVQKAQEAIENTIGKGCCSRLKTSGDTHRSTTSLPSVVSSGPRLGSAVPAARVSSGLGARASSGQSETKRHLLGQLSIDKSYLEELLQHPDMKSSNEEGHIASHAEEGIAFLKRRQEFWRQQSPASTTTSVPKITIKLNNKIKL